MALTENLAEFFEDFGVAAVLNGTTSVTGIFDDTYLEDSPGTAGIVSANPVFTCRAADVSAAVPGDTLLVNSTTYTIAEIQPDGTGLVIMQLHK